jgi:ABC-type transporter Mla subunit MlaD
MKPARAIELVVICIVVGAVAVVGVRQLTGASSSGYVVRAVFDNSSFVIPGEEVKVAGVTVGKISAVELTAQNHAAVVLDITNREFTPFQADAHCEIDLQSLLGEQYVQCSPSEPQAAGSAASPALPAISSGPYKGQHLLPVGDTTTPVGFDLLQDIYQLPEQEGLQLIISDLGAGLENNGKELNTALINADPALQETNQVISVLAKQDHTLAELTDDSAKVLAPLAAQSAHIGGFIRHAGTVATASAQESKAIEQNLEDFPAFLKQLKPATDRLASLAQQMTPALESLDSEAPSINASLKGLGPLAKASIPAFQTLGSLAVKGETVFPEVNIEVSQLLALSKPLQPLATDIAAISKSFDNAGGIEDVMRFIYYYTGSVNGEDSLGHYIRSLVEIGDCSSRSPTPVDGCAATFGGTSSSSSSSSADVSDARLHGSTAGDSATSTTSTSSAITKIAEEASKVAGSTNDTDSRLDGLTRFLLGQ